MPKNQDPLKVLTISSNEEMIGIINKSLKSEDDFHFINPNEIGEDLLESIENLDPDFILLDYRFEDIKPLDLIESLALQFPSIVVVIILRQDTILEANRAIMVGARAFIVEPFDHDQLLDTLKKIGEAYQRKKHGLDDISKGKDSQKGLQSTFSVFSPKGGVGCTTVAINTAIALKNTTGQEVTLMDGKFLFGDIDIMLNLKSHNSIADLISHLGAMDEGLINDVLSTHISGLKILPAPTNPLVSQGVHPQELHGVLSGLQKTFSYIVIDAGNYLYDNSVTMMDASHNILLVINPDMASLRDGSKFLEICLTSLSIPKEKILLVLNQYNQREGLKIKDIEDSLQMKVFAKIPAFTSTFLKSVNTGTPVMLHQRKSPLSKAYTKLAEDLIKLRNKK
jgi:pilus assembly protein CpaE